MEYFESLASAMLGMPDGDLIEPEPFVIESIANYVAEFGGSGPLMIISLTIMFACIGCNLLTLA
ncbi:hypothetical protein [Planctobacterium marinum]|uniref:hypothetical protein n=1 Tax=Planctobacterium marinum TaxID=1631968 RepID=UPI001E4C7842|nr:hypothetical protein [Planctobacterium marinum]MCC2607515.1 hypothetical protein [Planctobacterium marinum]